MSHLVPVPGLLGGEAHRLLKRAWRLAQPFQCRLQPVRLGLPRAHRRRTTRGLPVVHGATRLRPRAHHQLGQPTMGVHLPRPRRHRRWQRPPDCGDRSDHRVPSSRHRRTAPARRRHQPQTSGSWVPPVVVIAGGVRPSAVLAATPMGSLHGAPLRPCRRLAAAIRPTWMVVQKRQITTSSRRPRLGEGAGHRDRAPLLPEV